MEDRTFKISNQDIVCQLINFSLKHRRVMQSFLDETGVYHAQHRLLMEIAHNPNASQIDIAKLMDVSAVTIAVSLKKLEKGGYIKREVVEKDNRLNKIIITKKGNQVVEQSKEIFAYADQLLLKGFTDEEKYTLLMLHRKLDNNIVMMDEEIRLKKERKQ